MKAVCYGCGLPYCDPKFQDLIVPNAVWELINPSRPKRKGTGLLCPNCIIGKCEDLGLENVPFLFVSGPFAYDIDMRRKFTLRKLVPARVAAWIERLRYG